MTDQEKAIRQECDNAPVLSQDSKISQCFDCSKALTRIIEILDAPQPAQPERGEGEI